MMIQEAPIHPLDVLAQFYRELTLESLPKIREIYAEQAYFKDPFNEVSGISGIEKIFAHMFGQIKNPKFEIVSQVSNGNNRTNGINEEAFIVWLFYWQSAASAPPIRGSSHIKFNDKGQVVYHRDYWDAAEELYETAPILGTLLRWLKKRLRA
jgi:steroid Delta-isomerase